MQIQFANILVFIAVACAFVLMNNLMSRMFHTRRYSSEKYIPYECGEDPVDDARIKFNIRFYTTALIFLLFDVEIAFLFPWGMVFRQIGLLAFVEMFIFIFVLLIGLAYVWVKKDLDWSRSYRDAAHSSDDSAARETMSEAD